MSYVFFSSKYDREVLKVFQICEHHAKIVKLGRYGLFWGTLLGEATLPFSVLPVCLMGSSLKGEGKNWLLSAQVYKVYVIQGSK